jgi:flagellar motor switch protein FliN/FliY
MSENVEGQPMNDTPAPAAGFGPADRLQAVLDVDLPLVARFGGTVVPLKTLAALGSGSMVDMNRAPEDLVELLVGNRVIARGEVVVVSGHYGVRITELTEQPRPAAGSMEA